VNSFGFGGTNSHVILQSATPIELNGYNNAVEDERCHVDGSHSAKKTSNSHLHDFIANPPQLFVLSAKSKFSLLKMATNLGEWILKRKPHKDVCLRDLAFTLGSRRSLMSHRATFVASSADAFFDALQHPRVTKISANFRVSWLFTGQGAQWFEMARELLNTPIFGGSLSLSESILKRLGTSWSLIEELQKSEEDSRVNESEISQPATTAIQIGLVDLLRALNIFPQAVLGHSSGEIAAAYGAGVLSQESALKISYHRSFISAWCREDVRQKGAMLAVGLGEYGISKYISKLETGTAVIACANSPASTTISGDSLAIQELQEILNRLSIFNRRLKVDTAYHSHHMKAVADRYLRALGTIKTSPPDPAIKFFSSVTGVEKTSGFGASYWVDNLVSKVQFSDALQMLTVFQNADNLPTTFFLELGPHSALQGPVRQSLAPLNINLTKQLYFPTLVRDKNALVTILDLTGKLFEQGYPVNLQAVNTLESDISPNRPKVLYDLPSYAWNRERYWHESRISREYRLREHPYHDLLGLRNIGGNFLEPTWRNVLSIDALPWLNEHIIDKFALLPGSSFLCMAMEAMRQIIQDRKIAGIPKRFVMREVSFSKALVIPDSPGKIEVQLSFRQGGGTLDKNKTSWEEFCVTALTQDGKTWNEHCRGSIMVELTTPSEISLEDDFAHVEALNEERYSAMMAQERLRMMRKSCFHAIDSTSLYQELRKNGIDYGPTFASIRNLRIGHCEAVGTVIIPDVAACMPSSFMQPHIIHPATFDSLMHIVLPLYSRHCSPGPVMLTSIGEVTVSADIFSTPGQELLVACALSPTGTRSGTVDVSVFQGPDLESKAPVVTLSQEEFRGLGESHSIPRDYAAPRDSTYHAELINITDSLTPQKRQISSVRIIYNMSPFQKDLAHEISDTFTKLNLQVSCGTLKAQEFERGVTYLVIDSASQPLLIEPSPIHFRLINKMFQEADSVIWISIQDDKLSAANPEKDLIRGLARAARLKYNTLELATLDIQSEIQDMLHLIDTIMYISLEISKLSSPKDYDYIYNNGVLSIPRLIVDHAFDTYRATKDGKETTAIGLFHQIDRPLKIHIDTPGILESLVFVDDSAAQARLSDREVEIQVYAHAVNQTDVSVALGRSSSQMVGECAGVICAIGSGVPSIFQIGDRVCGWGASSSYGSRMKLDYRLIQKFPDSFSFAEGASIPFAFETAYYALIEVANLQKGQSILIHSAAGGVGQAAIMLAKNIGAEVFATVSSSSKRQMLIDKFGISKLNVFSSRTKSFRKAIIRATNGAGVDVVLNTLGENDMLLETWECIAKFGTFLNIGSISGQLPVKRFATSVTFSSINMSLMAQHQPAKVGRVLEIVMAMFRSKLLQPIQPITAIPITEITDAFRLIQHKRHSGKVVLTADDTTMVKQKKAQIPALRLNKTGKYLIVASDTTLLHDICQFMVVNGAEHLVLLLESHPQEAAFLSLIDSFDKKVEVQTCDITHRKKVVAAIAGLGNIKGVVQMSAFYPDDDPMTVNDYQVDGTRFLAEAALESSLDFFIMISPITHALGIGLNGGLSAGTAFQQAFAELQTNPETHYVSLSLGPISPKLSDLSAKQGDHYSQVDSEELYLLLEYVMSGAARSNGCHHLLAGLDKESLSQACPELLGDAIFNNLQEIETRGPSQTATSPKSIGQVLLDAESLQDARTIITVALAKQLSSLVALDVDDITLNLPISEIGLDSLIAIEFKNWIGRTLSAAMQTSEILDAANIQELAALITTRSTSVSKSLPDSSSTKDSPGSSAPSGPYSNKRPGFAQENDITVHSSDQSCLEQSSSSDHSTVPTPVSTTPSPLLKLPRQPLPDLESTLQLYLNSVRSFCLSAKELEHTRTVIEEFQQPGGLGTQLQERLLARYNDPNIQNWGAELYLASGFLERRVQLVPFSSFFFGHQLSHVPHSQAERAAVISTAAFEYKQLLDAGRIQSEILNEQPTCMELFQWIFNASRKPCIGADVMEKFPGNDYLIALKNGRAFKVLLRDEEKNIPFRELQAIFEVILDTVKENVSWEGILTADERNSWAKVH
jgi:NADPH:quinone reductase-like Zn-dependent oxidoreductase/malonyl CoA-acyl carrier protein transacylase